MPAILALRMKKWGSQKPRLHPYPKSVFLSRNATTATYPPTLASGSLGDITSHSALLRIDLVILDA